MTPDPRAKPPSTTLIMDDDDDLVVEDDYVLRDGVVPWSGAEERARDARAEPDLWDDAFAVDAPPWMAPRSASGRAGARPDTRGPRGPESGDAARADDAWPYGARYGGADPGDHARADDAWPYGARDGADRADAFACDEADDEAWRREEADEAGDHARADGAWRRDDTDEADPFACDEADAAEDGYAAEDAYEAGDLVLEAEEPMEDPRPRFGPARLDMARAGAAPATLPAVVPPAAPPRAPEVRAEPRPWRPVAQDAPYPRVPTFNSPYAPYVPSPRPAAPRRGRAVLAVAVGLVVTMAAWAVLA